MTLELLIRYGLIILVLLAMAIVAFVAFAVAYKKKFNEEDLKKIHDAWYKIEGYAKGDADRVFSEGDKLIGHAFELLGYKGSMADKLKEAKKNLGSDYQTMWWVHKTRNAIAHEVGYKVDDRDADRAVRILRRVLKRLKAL